MTVILIKAGLNLNPEAMQRLSCLVVRLAFTPCCVEAVSVMLAAHFILKVPLVWGLLMGFVIGAVSPAILVPSLLKLQKAGFGGQSGIHTLGIAASTIDDILAISAFGIISGLIFEHGTLVGDLIKGPVEVVLGISAGVLFGLLTIYLPHGSDKNVVPLRVFLLFSGGISFLFGAHRLGYEGAGPLACMISSFVASCGWNLSDDDPKVVQEVTRAFSGIWFVFEPILFSLIGADIQLSHLTMEMLGKSLAVLGLALLMRFAAAYLVTFGGVFQKKERLFLAIAWMPKASVQGLLGPIALEMATQAADQTAMIYGEYILTVAVLSILLTAPAGAIAIKLAGSRLLQKS
ncbi:sodium/hydrogen exchanger 9B2-like [Neocloeon triangulifer]|uniref:sodium/hydrogen exchanger 9B2-like n=1 Tax=Neocloeon triangulifer TaxID=2078957 RepID=UPI00286EFEF9|nr:sodium/hydrogen exchanger 9B2-like [Neocloeon triangulifer]